MANFNGTVKWFDCERGYGFISADDGEDIFIHYSHIKEDGHNKDLHQGQQVTFDVVKADKGPSAINVHKLN
ncbi:cold-shock protein [Faecalimicrobium dakarense]|uniref:cold-shock protein n=1 Tax=Faecalimicrobium dakarense TaxID=1301100 RepID=UPI0004BA575B|nr:cold-shock protein [[Clostridium] dakarense]